MTKRFTLVWAGLALLSLSALAFQNCTGFGTTLARVDLTEDSPLISNGTANRFQLTDELYPVATDTVSFEGVRAGNYDPTKLKNWNLYAFDSVIRGSDLTSQGPFGNVYSTELVRKADGSVLLFYHGNDYALESTHTDRIYQATSSNFLRRSKFDLSPPKWDNRAVALTDNNFDGLGSMVVGDPTVATVATVPAVPTVGPSQFPSDYIMYFSIAGRVQGGWNENKIGWAVTDPVNLGVSWFPADRPMGASNLITMTADGKSLLYMQRPSIVYDSLTKYYYLYFDQNGITDGLAPDQLITSAGSAPVSTATHFCTDLASSTIHPACDNPPTVYGGISQDGKNFYYNGPVLFDKNGASVQGSTVAVKKFSKGFLMFYDQYLDRLAYATSDSSDGKRFTDQGMILTSKSGTITNITQLTDQDSLRGVLFGKFPVVTALGQCDPAYTIYDSTKSVQYCINRGQVGAYFLQKQIIFRSSSNQIVWSTGRALDEDKLILSTSLSQLSGMDHVDGILEVYDSDQVTLLHRQKLTLRAGHHYSLQQI